MTSHGWFFGEATEKEKLLRIAEKVSEWNGVEAVHLVTGRYDIMIQFKFGYSEEYGAFRKLMNDLLREGVHNIETWFGLEWFKDGIIQE